MGCDVCMSADFDGFVDMALIKVLKARKPARCFECGKTIGVGDQYERYSGKYEGQFFVVRTCPLCAEIRDVFYCHGPSVSEELWEDMREYVFERLTTASECFQKLSPAAKEFVLAKWREWKGIAA